MRWTEMPPQAAELFSGYRSPRVEQMVLEQNMLIEVNLVRGLLRPMAESDHDVCRAPYLEPAARRPTLAWARDYPLDGEPADVAEVVLRYDRWAPDTRRCRSCCWRWRAASPRGSPEIIAWAARTFAAAEVESVGPGGHQTPEDQPDAIGAAIARWLRRHALTGAPAVAS
jgi:haloalkane dehalogenase